MERAEPIARHQQKAPASPGPEKIVNHSRTGSEFRRILSLRLR